MSTAASTAHSAILNHQTHIETVLGYESVRKRWNTKHGKDPTGQDIDRMYQNFVPKQKESLKEHCNVISG